MGKLLWPRRRCLKTLGSGAALAVSMPYVARAETGKLSFSVWRKGDEIGSHDMRFTRAGNEIVVDIDIQLGVKLLFIPVFEYRHKNQERWQGGQLAKFQSETNENGELFKVDTVRNGDQLVSRTLTERIEHPPHRKPTTYWHRSFLENTDWINTQNGSAAVCEIVESGRQAIDVLGETTETEHFRLTGDLKLDLWYRGNDWVQLTFESEDGSLIEYKLEELQPIDHGFG